jgi:hypothetical protein
MTAPVRDLRGLRIGALVVVEPLPVRFRRQVVWRCECICGGEAWFPMLDIVQGRAVSCGCQDPSSATEEWGETGRGAKWCSAFQRIGWEYDAEF